MMTASSRPGAASFLGRLLNESEGAQLIEFAVSLPLLIVVAVGIFDFGSAFTVKEKLVNAAQTGARVAAAQPANDLTSTSVGCPALASLCAVRDVVDKGLVDSGLSDCGLATASPTDTGSFTWTFTANTNCPGSLVVTVERAKIYQVALSAPFDTNPYQIVASQVTVSYPYQWQFGKVIGLLGGSFVGPAQIQTKSLMQNLN